MFTGLVQQMGTVTAVTPGDTTRVAIAPDAVSLIFSTEPGDPSDIAALNDGSYAVAQVTGVTAPTVTSGNCGLRSCLPEQADRTSRLDEARIRIELRTCTIRS